MFYVVRGGRNIAYIPEPCEVQVVLNGNKLKELNMSKVAPGE